MIARSASSVQSCHHSACTDCLGLGATTSAGTDGDTRSHVIHGTADQSAGILRNAVQREIERIAEHARGTNGDRAHNAAEFVGDNRSGGRTSHLGPREGARADQAWEGRVGKGENANTATIGDDLTLWWPCWR